MTFVSGVSHPPARHRIRRQPDDSSTHLIALIHHRPIAELRASACNARKHGKAQIAKLAASIREFGFVTPVLVTADCEIIAGEARVAAAREVGLTTLPTITVEHLTAVQAKAYRLADNQLASLAEWDFEILATEFESIMSSDFSDMAMLGWDAVEQDALLDSSAARKSGPLSRDVKMALAPISRPGDIWIMGKHRLLCGSLHDAKALELLMNGQLATLGFLDAGRSGAGAGRKHAKAPGCDSSHGEIGENVDARLIMLLKAASAPIANGGIVQVFTDWRNLHSLQDAARALGLTTLDLCVWTKSKTSVGELYRSKHELVLIFKKGNHPHINNISTGKRRRDRSNIWDYSQEDRLADGRHLTMRSRRPIKPVVLIADAIRDVTHLGDIVVDGLLDAETTILAAEESGRIGYGIEAVSGRVDALVLRWQAMTSGVATHACFGTTFAETASMRT